MPIFVGSDTAIMHPYIPGQGYTVSTTVGGSTVPIVSATNLAIVGGNNITLSMGTDATSGGTVSVVGYAQGAGLNTAQTNVTWTVNTSGISLNAGGYAGTVTGATGCSVTANTSGVSIAAPAITVSSYDPYRVAGGSTVSVAANPATSNVLSVFPMYLPDYVSVGAAAFAFSMNFTTLGNSAGSQTAGYMFGLYSRGTGTNSTTLGTIASQAVQWSVSGNNSAYSINQITQTAFSGYGATAQTASAGSNITSAYTGVKEVHVPINSMLSPGPYWLGIMGTQSTSSINVGFSGSIYGLAVGTGLTGMAPIGSLSSAYTTNLDQMGGQWYPGHGSWSSAGSVTGMPASIAFASISEGLTWVPAVRLWST